MIRIGICDDVKEERQQIYHLCETYWKNQTVEREYSFFSSGEEVLKYCSIEKNATIDLLVLDIEMNGMSGIALKNAVMKNNRILRIVFVTSHEESVFGAFGQKTMGYLMKPALQAELDTILARVLEEHNEERYIQIRNNEGMTEPVRLGDILFMRASGSYTEIVTIHSMGSSTPYLLSTRKLGSYEQELKDSTFVRIHKSYLVNLEQVTNVGTTVELLHCTERIPIGRLYRESLVKKYADFCREMIRKRVQ